MWEAIRQNKIKSVLLISLMGLLLLILGAVFGAVIARGGGGILAGISIAGVLWFFLTFIALVEGKNILLAFSGAKEVQSEDAPQLYNIVEEMKIASGLPTLPKIYIIESKAPNAFAVGSPDNCAVAITSGLLAVLTRDELQGVIAHEIGHIKNQDTKFLTITGVMLGTIVILSDIFTRTMFYGSMMGGRRSRSSRDSGGQAQVVLLVVGIILAILAPLLAQIIYLACSRSREYLADASAAVFTRFPEGLASALEKISAKASIPLEAANRVTAPMFIVPPMGLDGKSFASVFSTHPPTEERVKILRSMSGGAGFSEYNKVFRQVTGKDVINSENLLSAEQLKLRGISREDDKTEKRRSREANDLVMKLHNYKFINCECGIKIKIPPNYQDSGIRCPRCGRAHSI
jgi:heat shock protein HtpX